MTHRIGAHSEPADKLAGTSNNRPEMAGASSATGPQGLNKPAHKQVSEVRLKPQNIPTATESAQARARFAPLASLDCSLTEPIEPEAAARGNTTTTSQQGGPPPATRRGPPTDTPTLSGYFDCDELSDMVDDSLFEITAAGCLSRSVFGRPLPDVPGSSQLAYGPEDKIRRFGSSTSAETDQDGQQTPTNEPKPAEGEGPVGLVALRAQLQPFDYSSSSRASLGKQPSGRRPSKLSRRQADQQQQPPVSRASQARRKARSNPDVRAEGGPSGVRRLEMGSQPAGTKPSSASSSSSSSTSSSLSSSSPNSSPNSSSSCPICREQVAADRKRSESRHRGRRFARSLFNLFTGSSSSSSSNSGVAREPAACQHRQNSSRGPSSGLPSETPTSSGQRLPPGSSTKRPPRQRPRAQASRRTGSGLKSRDSIRITNQRKFRGANDAKQVAGDDRSRPDEPRLAPTNNHSSSTSLSAANRRAGHELLLDLSLTSNYLGRRATSGARSAHDNDGKTEAPRRPAGNFSSAAAGLHRSRAASAFVRRPLDGPSARNKSVKFTTPDRVMILPTSAAAPLAAASHLPQAHLQPAAPIIKLPMPKSSSYSQTEPNKSLDELLARYEADGRLVEEISKRLRLTETIASGLSALDRADEDEEQEQEQEREEGEEGGGEPHAGISDSTLDESITTAALERIELVAGPPEVGLIESDETDASQCACNRSARAANGPTSGRAARSAANGEAKSEGSTGAEAAGFSREWLSKRPGLV